MNTNYLFFETDFNLLDEEKNFLQVKCYFELINKKTGETYLFANESTEISINNVVYDLDDLFEVTIEFNGNTFNILFDLNPEFENILETFQIDVVTTYLKNVTELISKSEFETILFSSNYLTFSKLLNKIPLPNTIQFQATPLLTEQDKEVLASDDFWQWALKNCFDHEFSNIYNSFPIPYQNQQKVKEIITDEIWKYKFNCTDFEDFYAWCTHVTFELAEKNSTYIENDFFQEIILKISKHSNATN